MIEIAQLSQKYQTMTRAHLRGAQDGSHNLPSSADTVLSSTELAIIQIAQSDIAAYSSRQAEENDETLEQVRLCKSELSSELSPNIDAFRAKAELKLNEAERELMRDYENVLARERDYRYFKTVNRLNRDADVSDSIFVSVCLLIFMIVGEGAINSYFFMDVNPYALVGGFLLAAIISVFNVVVGFAAGMFPWRYCNHRKRLNLIWAVPLLAAMLTFISFFNLAVGHYRDLVSTNKDALPSVAINEVLTTPLGLHSIQSILLTAVGIIISMVAARKGYAIRDPYPGFGRCYLRRERAKDLFEQRRTMLERAINSTAEVFLDDAKAQRRRTNKSLQTAINAVREAISRNDRYREIFDGVEKACAAAVRSYRDANIEVRDRVRFPEPNYFSEPITLTKNEDGVDLESLKSVEADLLALEDRLKANFDALCQSVPIQARQLLSQAALDERLEKIRRAAGAAERENSASEGLAA